MYTQKSARALMNRYGREGRPFAFVLPYDTELTPCLLEPLSENHAGEIYYDLPGGSRLPALSTPLPPMAEWQPSPPSFEQYRQSFEKIQYHLHRGNSYLVNLCFATPVRSNLSLEQMFLCARARYKMLVPGRFTCFSPEPFVTLEGNRIRTFPMKGTARGSQALADLLTNRKEQREHATVVDLLRNDLALVARQVEVERYRYVERIATHRGDLHATSSSIVATLPQDWPSQLGDLLFTLLPAGSVTGAPKAWTCRAIQEAEPTPRGYYTGVFGLFDGSRLESAVSIRFVEQVQQGTYLYRSGGGITTLSDVEAEYRELCDKVYLPFNYPSA